MADNSSTDNKPSRLQQRIDQSQRDMIQDDRQPPPPPDRSSGLLNRLHQTGELKPPEPKKPPLSAPNHPMLRGTGPLRSTAQISDRFLPLTRMLPPLLPNEPLRVSEIPDFDPVRFDTTFRIVGLVLKDLEDQLRVNDDADHPRLHEAAAAMLGDRVAAARLMLEMFGHMKHARGDNAQTYETWTEQEKNSATVVLHQFLFDYEEFLADYDVEPEAAIAQGLAAFVTYATPTSHLPHHQATRYRAIKILMHKAIEVGRVSGPPSNSDI